jgi:rare lipoprotein A
MAAGSRRFTWAMVFTAFVLLPGCATFTGSGSRESGMASWYGKAFHGRRTASGERYDMNALTAAHPRLPFGTKVRVTCQRNGKSVVVRINDRGPYARGRIIDLSFAAARRLELVQRGEDAVKLEVLSN